MPIPAGTKFHGVAPSVDTENRGSSNANADRDAYAIEDFNGTSFQAYLTGSGQEVIYDTIVKLGAESPDNNTGFPTVGVTNQPPNYFYRDYVDSEPVGIVMAGATKGSTVEVVVQGHQTKAKVLYYEGVTPDRGDNLYSSAGGSIAGGRVDLGDYMAVGQVTGIDPVLVKDYGIYGAIWEVQVYYSFPAENSYYIDGIAYLSSVRQSCATEVNDDSEVGDIVKIDTPDSQTLGRINITRVEASDPIEAFVGIATDCRKSPGSLSTDYVLRPDMVCMSGNVFLPAWTINGPVPVQGGLIYVDATTPHKLTTDSTSGTVVGLVQALDENSEDVLERVLIQVKL